MSFLEIGNNSLSELDVKELLKTDHPMVEEFQFEKSNDYEAKKLWFALKIIPKSGIEYMQQRNSSGRRITPVRKTLSGKEIIGQGNRVIYFSGDELVAENSTFFPNQEFNDLGIGSALYVSMERLYRKLGIRQVTLLAVDVGVYVWARQGFAFHESRLGKDLVTPFNNFLKKNKYNPEDQSRLNESWDYANYNIPGETLDDYRIGKYFMLNHMSGWYGIKFLDDGTHNKICEASRKETFSRLPDKIKDAPSCLKVR
jgi:hypothetical protein